MQMDLISGRLPIPGLYNARDLGAMKNSGGKALSAHRLIRSDALDHLSDEDIELLASYPVGVVIDLRSESEAARNPDKILSDPRFTYYNFSLLPISADYQGDSLIQETIRTSLGKLYIWMAENAKEAFACVFRTILKESPKTVLFHCAHGKDRTGLITALFYLLCGVSREDIISNYAVSYEYVKELVAPLIAKNPPETAHIFRSDEENIRMFLSHLDENYGGKAEVYLESIGLTNEEISELRSILLP